MVHSRLQPQLLAQQKAQFDTKSTAKQPVFKIILTAFRLSPVFSETNFANFQICLGFGKGFVENMARILRGLRAPACAQGGGGCLPACLPDVRLSVHLCGLSFAGSVLPLWSSVSSFTLRPSFGPCPRRASSAFRGLLWLFLSVFQVDF